MRLRSEGYDMKTLDPRQEAVEHVRVVQRGTGVEHAAFEPLAEEPRNFDDALVEAHSVPGREVLPVAEATLDVSVIDRRADERAMAST
jgi:hypothetical protein